VYGAPEFFSVLETTTTSGFDDVFDVVVVVVAVALF